ncbi:hypothetical protein N7532_009678 [Penicillium argentinense]|uniref:Uncharacterized protein n=1 Tax=Penicillium argentinense TaxID=1131581 RepID=A0A9W9EZQ3_9EURO|nr:uncharacterized protein N7532_009678 [Penicillium argentinense]KAJ5090994.1 hypothetical protein N7532_009678 [Penicillium argentinense]
MAPRKGEDSSRRTESRSLQPLRPNAISKSAQSAASKRRPGRRLKHSRDTPSQSRSPLTGSSASPSVAPPVRRRALCMLEVLPVEVIELIFLYSLNLNLPRASPVLAAAISREHIYGLLIILACWDDPPTDNPFSKAMAAILAPLDYVPLTLDERSRLQEAVFRCRWCTMQRVREQIPKMMILTLHRHWINAGMVMKPDQQATLDRFMTRQEGNKSLVLEGKGKPLHRFAELLSQQSPQIARMAQLPGPHDYELHIKPNVLVELRSLTWKTSIVWPAIQLHAFPPRLLRGRSGGFTADDVTFLEMLRLCSNNFWTRSSQLRPDSQTLVDRTALHQGVTNAIRTSNLNAMTSLLKIDEFTYRFGSHNDGRATYYTIPSDHFLTVTRSGRDNPHLNQAFFEALIRASAESIPAHSPEITQWCVENMQLGEQNPPKYSDINGRFAKWLSDFILRLPAQIDYAHNTPSAQLFYCGQLDVMDLEGCRFLDEVLSPCREPLMDYMDESSFHPEHFWVDKQGNEPS